VDVLVTKHLSNLPIAQWRFIFSHFPRDLRPGIIFGQELLCSSLHGNGIICSVEYLESETAFLNGKIAYLSKVTSIDVAPRVSFSGRRIVDVSWKVSLILMGFDDVADAECIDIILEATGKSACCLLSTDFRECVSGENFSPDLELSRP
jgi:hypothetical protein